MFGAAGVLTAAFGLERAAFANAQQPLVAATFQPFVGDLFMVDDDGVPVGLRLLRVVGQPRSPRPSSMRDPFSLIFSSPWQKTLVAQTYLVRLPNSKTVDMFIMPISANKYRYEAPFN
jgi:hypothetical protein